MVLLLGLTTKRDYRKSLKGAQAELTRLLEQRAKLDKRIAALRQAIGGLAHLSDDWDAVTHLLQTVKRKTFSDARGECGLKEACREVLLAQHEPVTPAEVLEGIERLGRTGDRDNLLASVHTTLRRMAQHGEVEEGTKHGKKAYQLSGS